MKCPTCGLENPPFATQCDCGVPLGNPPNQVIVQESVPKSDGTTFSSVMIRLAWAAALLCAVFAMLDFLASWSVQQGAPSWLRSPPTRWHGLSFRTA